MFPYLNSFQKVTELPVIFDFIRGNAPTFFDTECCTILARSGSLQGLFYRFLVVKWLQKPI